MVTATIYIFQYTICQAKMLACRQITIFFFLLLVENYYLKLFYMIG